MTIWFVTEYTKQAGVYRFLRTKCNYQSKEELVKFKFSKKEVLCGHSMTQREADNLIYLTPSVCLLFIFIDNIFKDNGDNTHPNPDLFQSELEVVTQEIINITIQRSIRNLHYTMPIDIVRHLTKSARGISLKAYYLKAILECYTPQADLVNLKKLKDQFDLLRLMYK